MIERGKYKSFRFGPYEAHGRIDVVGDIVPINTGGTSVTGSETVATPMYCANVAVAQIVLHALAHAGVTPETLARAVEYGGGEQYGDRALRSGSR